MLSTVSERKMHVVRWVIFIAWCVLIASLFYDPFTAVLTHPGNDWASDWSPLIDRNLAQNPSACVMVQGECADIAPYPIATRVFWGMVVPSAIFVVLVLGHEFWRRICPLYFFSQLPRALGLQPLLNIEKNIWLKENHLRVQFVLFLLGISARILLINSVRPALGVFLIVTLLAAAGVVALYGGRSWCHYVCPFGMVQTVFTGPRGLLDSKAHTAKPFSVTQSMCRTETDGSNSREQSGCVSCEASCMDIDSEGSYWSGLYKPGRQMVQYGYLGLVVGYFAYYWLYAGNFGYYFSGVWSYERGAIANLFSPGFYLFGHEIWVVKLVAVPLTLIAFAATSCWLCTLLELRYRGWLKSKGVANAKEKSLHRVFSVCTFTAFNAFFVYGGRPEINQWPVFAQLGFQGLIAVVSGLWLQRTWGRSRAVYEQESQSEKLRSRLKKLPTLDLIDSGVEDLGVEALDVLDKVLPNVVISPEESQVKAIALPKTIVRRERKEIPLPKTQIRKRK
ncbi:MAG: 4Fe-4S binding protein [Cyanobacteria bacterium J06648_10]